MRLGDLDTERPLLTARQIAAQVGVTLSTWQAYVARGQAPRPDEYAERTPLWYADTVADWLTRRSPR